MRWLIALGLTFITLAGCSLEEALENAPCESDDDCLGEQTCVKTAHQLANNVAGWCRSDGKCATGEQEGCISNGTCSGIMSLITDASGNSYCCGASDATLLPSDDFTSAQCVSCPTDLCTQGGDATEPCSAGDSRCVVEAGAQCGCRVPAAEIENSECETDETCGEGFLCVRTLEQLAEPEESLPEERDQESGFCRPTEAPECASGLQEGCRTEAGCDSGQTEICAGSRCYCCDVPTNSSEFNAHVYMETELGESAACTECPRSPCTMTSTCTELEDPTCVVSSGVCGCLP